MIVLICATFSIISPDVAVVRQRVMAVRDADLAIGARSALARDEERHDARQVGLKRDGVIMSVISLKCSAKSLGMP